MENQTQFENSIELVKHVISLIINKRIPINGDCDCGQAGTYTKYDKTEPVKKLDDIIADTAKRVDEYKDKIYESIELRKQLEEDLINAREKMKKEGERLKMLSDPLFKTQRDICDKLTQLTAKKNEYSLATLWNNECYDEEIKQLEGKYSEIRKQFLENDVSEYERLRKEFWNMANKLNTFNPKSYVANIFEDMSGTIPTVDGDGDAIYELLMEYYESHDI
jgi:exonuclease VII large subunit